MRMQRRGPRSAPPRDAAMVLNDGAADKQADAHAIILGRVQRIEQWFSISWGETQRTAYFIVHGLPAGDGEGGSWTNTFVQWLGFTTAD